jgi:hypothetical protein
MQQERTPIQDGVQEEPSPQCVGQPLQRQAGGNAAGQEAMNSQNEAFKISWHSHFHELAKKVAYDGKLDPERDKTLLSMWSTVAFSGRGGFSMVICKPLKPGVPAVVAFRGTDDMADVLADLGSGGPGEEQFRANLSLIQHVTQSAGRMGPMVLTGHSLGGALAQLTAATFGRSLSIAEVVTFQSAGVSAELIQKFNALAQGKKPQVTHWIAENDSVSTTGAGMLKGTTYEVRNQKHSAEANPVGLHTMDLLQNDGAGRVGTTGPTRKLGPGEDPRAADRLVVEQVRAELKELVSYLCTALKIEEVPTDFKEFANKLESAMNSINYAWNSKEILEGLGSRVVKITSYLPKLQNESYKKLLW